MYRYYMQVKHGAEDASDDDDRPSDGMVLE